MGNILNNKEKERFQKTPHWLLEANEKLKSVISFLYRRDDPISPLTLSSKHQHHLRSVFAIYAKE